MNAENHPNKSIMIKCRISLKILKWIKNILKENNCNKWLYNLKVILFKQLIAGTHRFIGMTA